MWEWMHSATNLSVIQTFGTLLSGLGAVIVLYIMSKQMNREARVAGCEFILKVSQGYDTQEMKDHRTRLANVLLSGGYPKRQEISLSDDFYHNLRKYASPVLGYFADLGMMLRQNLVPTYFVWATSEVSIRLYYELMEDYIKWVRRIEDPSYYTDFEYLYKRISKFERKQSRKTTRARLEGLLRELGRLLPGSAFSEPVRGMRMAEREFLLRELNVQVRPFDASDVDHAFVPTILRDKLLGYEQQGDFIAIAEILDKGDAGHEYLGYLVGTTEEISRQERRGEIREVFVDSRIRHNGIGESLCMYFLQRLSQWDIRTCTARVPATDELAEFYGRLKFVKTALLQDFFGTGRHAHEFVRYLHGEVPLQGPDSQAVKIIESLAFVGGD